MEVTEFKRRRFARPRRGFTLSELLVVVCAVALLISILLPALVKAREAARKTRCVTNLHQWGLAVSMYADSSNGYLPRRGQGVHPTMLIDRPQDWFNALPPMLKMNRYVDRVHEGRPPKPGEDSLWVCPTATDPGHKYFFAYAMNMMLSTWWTEKPDRIDNVGPPETMVFMTDGPGPHCSVVPSANSYGPVPRHRGWVNIVFLDTHATSFRGEQVGCGVGDPHRSDIRWVVPGSKWPGPDQP